MARSTNYKKQWEKEQWNHLITLEAFDECLIHLAKTMREGGMPERSWLFLVVHPIEMLSDWRFSDEVLEQ